MYHSGKNNWDFYASGVYRILLALADSFRAWLFRMSWSKGGGAFGGQSSDSSYRTTQNPSGDKNSSYRYYNRKYPYQSYNGGYRPDGQQGAQPEGKEAAPPPSGQHSDNRQVPPVQPDGSYRYSYKKAEPPKTQPAAKTPKEAEPVSPAAEQEKKGGRISPVPYLGALICVALYILLVPLRQWYDFLILGLLTFSVFLLLLHFFPGAKKKAKRAEKEKMKSTGNREIDKMIAQGNKVLEDMRQANVAIENQEISAQITRLEKTTEKIFRYVAENPKRAPQIRKFMNYYLPTTLKLLRSYDRLSDQEIEGENISGTMHDIEGILHTIVMAFDKQLDHLFQDEAMDIATDITVLESMMAQEGLTDSRPKASDRKHT